MNEGGWRISEDHYNQWCKNVGSRRMNAPHEKYAQSGRNKGRIRYQSTAVYGKTIFWKVVDIKKPKK